MGASKQATKLQLTLLIPLKVLVTEGGPEYRHFKPDPDSWK